MKTKTVETLKIDRIDGDLVWIYCPFHNDSNRPNMSISLNKQFYGIYRCWACGKSGCLTKKQMKLLQLKPVTEKKIIKHTVSELYELHNQYKSILNTSPIMKLQFAHELRVSPVLLTKWGVRYDNIAYTIPMYIDAKLVGIQRRFTDGSKKSVSGSKLGFFINNYSTGETLYICEGFTDTISVDDLGFTAIGKTCCSFNQFVMKELFWFKNLKHVIIVSDSDDVGIEYSNKLQKILSPKYKTDIFIPKDTKDVRELIQLKGKNYVKELLGAYNVQSK